MLYVLNPISRPRCIEYIVNAPDGYRVKVDPLKRSLAQNDLIQPIIREIANSAGRPTDRESLRTLRYLLLEAWRNETHRQPIFVRSLDGMRMVNVESGTSELDKVECSEFIEWLYAWRALHENNK
jgi:hypothetical protein